jgi:TubC N-terminal docking domain
VNALSLYHDLKARGVILEAQGERLKVDAPAGVVMEEDKTALLVFKPTLLKFLSRNVVRAPEDNEPRFQARRSRHPGYTSLYDPVYGEWHDFPTKDCLPSIVAETDRGKRGA